MQSLKLITMGERNVYNIRLEGFVKKDEMMQLHKTAKNLLANPANDFCVFSDLRGFKPASEEVQGIMGQIQQLFKENGLQKVAILVDKETTKMQLKRLHAENEIKGKDAFFSSEEADFMKKIEAFLSE